MEESKKEFNNIFYGILLTCIIFFLLISTLFIFYKPDTITPLKVASIETCVSLDSFTPEPQESITYILGLLFFPFCFSIIYFLLSASSKYNYNSFLLYKYTYPFYIFGMTILVIIGLLNHPEYTNKLNYNFYFNKTILGYRTIIVYLIILLIVFYLYKNKSHLFRKRIATDTRLGNILYYLILILILFISFVINIFDANAVTNDGVFSYHLNAMYYSVVHVYNGNALYINNFVNTYGLYPHFLEPLFKLTGGISLFKFSIIMGFFNFVTYYSIYLSLSKIIKSKLILIIGFTALFFFQYYFGKAETGDYYFQYNPLRTILPSLLLLLSISYSIKPTPIKYLLGFILSSVSILWNFDSGLVVFIAWILFLCYREFTPNKTISQALLFSFNNIILQLLTTTTIFIFFYYYILLRYNGHFAIDNWLYITKLFTSLGYFMIPMPLVHPWNIVLIVYLSSLAISIAKLIQKNIEWDSPIYFITSIMGLGLFLYYIGRSHNWNLLNSSIPFFVLLTLITDKYYLKFKENTSLPHQNILLSIIILFLFSSTLNMIFYTPYGLYKLVFARNNIMNSNSNDNIISNIYFIKKNSSQNEKVLLLSGNQGVYLSETHLGSIFNTGLTDLFLKSDYNSLMNIISNNQSYSLFLDTATYKDETIIKLVRSKWRVKAKNNDSMYLFQKF